VLTKRRRMLESWAFVVTREASAFSSEQGTPVKLRDGQAAVCRLQLNGCVRHSFQNAIVPDWDEKAVSVGKAVSQKTYHETGDLCPPVLGVRCNQCCRSLIG